MSKNLKRELKLPIAPYGGLAYGTYEDRLRAIGGISVGFSEAWNFLVVYDGVNYHPILSYSIHRHVVSVLLVDRRDPGVSYSLTFGGRPPSSSDSH